MWFVTSTREVPTAMQLKHDFVLGVQTLPTCKILNADSNTIRGDRVNSGESRGHGFVMQKGVSGSKRSEPQRLIVSGTGSHSTASTGTGWPFSQMNVRSCP